jgi:hypothetical protein
MPALQPNMAELACQSVLLPAHRRQQVECGESGPSSLLWHQQKLDGKEHGQADLSQPQERV